MQDPSHGVAQQLQNHVHLISGHRFPLLPRLDIEQAFRYLIDAPTIVKQTAPMAWNYVSAPPDGTMWLEWISSRNGEYRFPSDGFVWGDPEQAYRQEFGGYTIEMMMHTVGFRPGAENMASHARTRYHFLSKNPSVNAAPPDPSLWIVHYHQAEHHRMMPASQLPITPNMRQILTERRWLEGQGKLERKEFMLHDREHWPTLSLPGSAYMSHMQQQGMYANQMMQQQTRFPQHQYPQQPPAKRPRTSGPNAPGPSDGIQDTSIEDEENTSLGDFFDHLSPREISMARYMQHHRWMEEVFSSPYASSQIVPPDLGLGLMGELKGLTEGILEQPSVDETAKPLQRPEKAKEAQPFTNLTKEQVDEFTRRVDKHLEDGRAEIERMKREHAEKMAEWKKTKTVMQAEKKLRYATWDGHESAVPVYRLDIPATNGHVEEIVPATVEDVVKEVEDVLKVKIKGHKDATMIEKGGLGKEEEPQPGQETVQEGAMQLDRDVPNMQDQKPMMTGANGSINQEQPVFNQQHYSTSETQGQALEPSVPADVPQPTFANEQPQRARPDPATEEQQRTLDNMDDQHHLDDVEGMGMGDHSFVDDMVMDVDTGDIDFIEHDEASGDEAGVLVEAPEPSANLSGQADLQARDPQDAGAPHTAPGGLSHSNSPVTFGETGEQRAMSPQQVQQQQQPLSTGNTEAIAADESAIDDSEVPQETALGDIGEQDPGIAGADHDDLFDDGTFDDLGNVDNGAGDDGLIDFDGGGMGMDESAFGDALHGMDTSTPFGHQEGVGDDRGLGMQ